MQRFSVWLTVFAVLSAPFAGRPSPVAAQAPPAAPVTAEQVQLAIAKAVSFLKGRQQRDGSWDLQGVLRFPGGVSCLVTLALLESGVDPRDPAVVEALKYIRKVQPDFTYVVALQTMALAAAGQPQDLFRIRQNVEWLAKAQTKRGPAAGMWGYQSAGQNADNSNSQYALLGLWAADDVGVSVESNVWRLARNHWINTRNGDGGWGYKPGSGATGSMTVAGISSLVITGEQIHEGRERIVNGLPQNCGLWEKNPALEEAIAWMGRNFSVTHNPNDQQWLFYYLYGLERAGRLSGQRFFGDHDWYREGAEQLVRAQDGLTGKWIGNDFESEPVLATSFGLLFLAKGRTPVLINKLKYGPADDWQNDRHDIRRLTEFVGTVWKRRLTWQVVDLRAARLDDLLQAPVVFFNGHQSPDFTAQDKRKLRDYVAQGGFILAEACCNREEFDRGFRALIKELYPESDYELRLLPSNHPIWTAQFNLAPADAPPLWGVDVGCRTSIVYSPTDLSCFWQQWNPRAKTELIFPKPLQLGTNIVSYATGRELADKLAAREVIDLAVADKIDRSSLQLAQIRHSGGWNAAPLALRNLAALLRKTIPLDVSTNLQDIYLTDKRLPNYPLIYMHGRNDFTLNEEERAALRRHLTTGGVLFADACCGSAAFDRAFRRIIEQVFPDLKLQRIPPDHRLFTEIWHDLRQVRFNRALGGRAEEPYLEGIELDGRYVVIYSKFDIGCAIERHQSLECLGYTHEDAVRIATNVVLYALLD